MKHISVSICDVIVLSTLDIQPWRQTEGERVYGAKVQRVKGHTLMAQLVCMRVFGMNGCQCEQVNRQRK